MSPFQAAESLADLAIPSFPCRATKAPLTRRGFYDATINHDPANWAEAALVGVPTGAAGGFDVLDVDLGGLAWLAANEHRLPITRRVRTRSGGLHLYFRARPAMRCSTGTIAPGVDCRAEAGYVIAWQCAGFPVEHADTLADWPAWLADLAAGPRVRHADNLTRSAEDLAPPSVGAAVSLLDRLPNPPETSRDTYIAVMMAAQGCIRGLPDDDGADEIAEAAIGWAARWRDSPGYDAESAKWHSDFAHRDAPLAGWRNLLAAADKLGADTAAERTEAAVLEFAGVALPPPVAAAPAAPGRLRMRDRLLRPADCETGARRGYVLKHLLAPGDVAAIIGPPGCGKSQLSPFLGYAVAQGRAVFGSRAKPGAVLYVAAEDVSGMRQRVAALRRIHGDAPDFALTDCGNLNDAAAVSDLLDAVTFLRPAVVFVDTVGAAWAGMDENDSAGMGAVVATARRIAATGAAVVLVHHTAKSGDGTPRGHSVLNGTLDMCLALSPLDENRIVRGTLQKNRNGPCDRKLAFRSVSPTLGMDDDGDAITAPIACELAASAEPAAPKLTERETQAFAILADLATDDSGVAEAEWLNACEDARVSTSENPRNRRTAITRIFHKLIENGSVAAGAGRYRVLRVPPSLQQACNRGKPGCNRVQSAATEFSQLQDDLQPMQPDP